MSNEPLRAQPEPDSPPAPADRAADAALMLAAVERMEAVVRGERATFERLRADLGDMASTVALAKAALASFAIKPDAAAADKGERKPDDVGALLQAIEDRIKAMVEVVEGAKGEVAATAAVTEPQAIEEPPAETSEVAAPPADDTAVLETLFVEALAPDPLDAPQPASAAPEPAAVMEPEPPAAPEPAVAIEPERPAPTVSAPVMMPDVDLMTSFAQVAAMPVLPSEIGTAVIFTAKSPEPEPEPQPAPPPAAVIAEALPAEILSAETAPAAIAPVETAPVEAPAAELSNDEDPAEFLYEPDPDPASFLLEPISFVPTPRPEPAQAVAPAQPAAAMLPPLAMMPPEVADAPQSAPSVEPAAEPEVPPDPLAPLKAMSAEEKIALFS